MNGQDPFISVITWDGGFRENFHTVDYFCRQRLPVEDYEFIWVEYYASLRPELDARIGRYDQTRSICLHGDGEWHVAKCMNRGITLSRGRHLVLADGDVAVTADFLEQDLAIHAKFKGSAVYYRRWDEPPPEVSSRDGENTLEFLETRCRLTNPTNYGGCLTLDRTLMDIIGGYEEHALFSGAGAVSMELYVRLRNAGVPIVWHPTVKLYHPWHPGTIPSNSNDKISMQKKIIEMRGLRLDKMRDAAQVEEYIHQASGACRVGGSSRRGLQNMLGKVMHHLRG